MAQNIPLVKSSGATFARALKNIKTLMKKNEGLGVKDVKRKVPKAKVKRRVMGVTSKPRPKPSRLLGRGVVYLGHIPKGFYEDEMQSYFSQFGRVTRLNVVRSRKTGNPKGYAFIEFLYSEVAQVVAETMNNYLMCDKLLKAEYIPEERVRRNMFTSARICPENCPRAMTQRQWIEKTNKQLSEAEVSEMAEHELKRLDKLKKQMEDEGIFFDCQVDGMRMPITNNTPTKAVLEVDESDEEIEFKVHPHVTKVIKHKDSAAKKGQTPPEDRRGFKRSLSSSSNPASTPEKKKMTLLQEALISKHFIT